MTHKQWIKTVCEINIGIIRTAGDLRPAGEYAQEVA